MHFFAHLLICSRSRSLPVIVAALACECPQTRRKKLRETGLGIGYGERSTGDKQRRADAKAMEEQIDEQVDHDAVKHLELLEYMLSKYKTDHPTILPLQQTNLALTVLSGFQDFIATLKERFKGRYPNVVRQDLQAVLSVAASKCDCNELQELATLLGTSYEKLKVRKKMYHDFVDRLRRTRRSACTISGRRSAPTRRPQRGSLTASASFCRPTLDLARRRRRTTSSIVNRAA